MNFGTIEIICKPCQKCQRAEKLITKAFKELGQEFEIEYKFKIEQISDLSIAQAYSANIAQMPFVVVNNELVFAGNIPDVGAVKFTLLSIIRNQHLPLKGKKKKKKISRF